MALSDWNQVRPLGAGHFGQVWLVNRIVMAGAAATQAGALKILKDASNQAQALSAANEITKLAELDHPNLSRFIESGKEDGCPWFVMNFVDGESLQDRIKNKGPLPHPEWVAFVEAMLDALSYLRQKNISHLDIKPDNIIRSESGKYTLVDFGLSSKTFAPATPLHNLSWSSPEQMGIVSAPESHASDLFSFGMAAYFALTGTRPYSQNDFGLALQRQPADLSKADEAIRIWLQPALALNPKSRPEAKTLLNEFRDLQSGKPARATEVLNPLTWREFEEGILYKLNTAREFLIKIASNEKGTWIIERDSDSLEGQTFFLKPESDATLLSPSSRTNLEQLGWRIASRQSRELMLTLDQGSEDLIQQARLVRDTLVRGLSLAIENITIS
jgi:serine/threonine protein kinase